MTIIDRQAQTSAERSTHENSVRDIVGIGIGPGNLGLAVAIEEQAPELDALFVEARPEFNWHPGMLLEGSNMQISFLKTWLRCAIRRAASASSTTCITATA